MLIYDIKGPPLGRIQVFLAVLAPLSCAVCWGRSPCLTIRFPLFVIMMYTRRSVRSLVGELVKYYQQPIRFAWVPVGLLTNTTVVLVFRRLQIIVVAPADVVRARAASASAPVSQGTALSRMALNLMSTVLAVVGCRLGCCCWLLWQVKTSKLIRTHKK